MTPRRVSKSATSIEAADHCDRLSPQRNDREASLTPPRRARAPRRSLLYPSGGFPFAAPAAKGNGDGRFERRPPACKAGALPLSYSPAGDFHANSSASQEEETTSLARYRAATQCVAGRSSMLRRILSDRRSAASRKYGQGGLEPPTPRISSGCSNQLSYWPRYAGSPQFHQGEGCAVGARHDPEGSRPGMPTRRPVLGNSQDNR